MVKKSKQNQEATHSASVRDLNAQRAEIENQKVRLRDTEDSRDKYLDLYNFAPIGFLTIDQAGGIVQANLKAAEMFGTKCEKLVGKPFSKYVAEADRDAFAEHQRNVLSGGGICECTLRLQPPKAALIHVRMQSVVEGAQAGGGSRLRTALIDITAPRRAEAGLRESELRFRALVTASSEMLYRMSPDWSELRVVEGQGYIAATTKPNRRWLSDYIPREDRPLIREEYRRAIESRSIFQLEHRVRRSDGSVAWVHSRAVPMLDENGNIVEWFGAANDITERKKAEEALRESESRFLALLTATSEMLYRMTADWGVMTLVQGQPFIAHPNRPTRDWMKKFVPPKDHPGVREAIRKATESKSVYQYEHRFYRQGGGIGWTLSRAVPLLDDNGKITEWFGVASDITLRKESEEALRESEQRYRAVVENTTAIILRIRGDGVITYANDRAIQFFGYSREELVGKHVLGTIVPESDSAGRPLTNLIQQVAANLDLFHSNANENICKDGRRVWMEWTNSGFYGPGGEVAEILSVGIDATDRKRAEDELLRAKAELEQRVTERTRELSESLQTLNFRTEQLQRLASELTMTEQHERRRLAQVLHDGLQQILVAARMRLEKLARIGDPEVRSKTNEVFDLLSDSIEISRSLTAELSPPILHEGGLIPALEWLVRWMYNKQGLVIDLEADIDLQELPEELTILLFQSTRELLFNVVKHAGVKSARVRLAQQENQLVITVADEGAGFNATAWQKHASREGGFGLFSIRERIDLLGGRLDVDSAPGHGTRVSISAPHTLALPAREILAETPLASVGYAIPPKEEVPEMGRRIRVMLVDDHIVMRQGLRALLRDQPDIDVIGEASDGEAAIKLAHEINPDVILMDVSMPRMNGIEATRAIHGEMPETRVIGLSMFEEADRAEAMREAGAVNYLAKTGPSEALVAAVRASAYSM